MQNDLSLVSILYFEIEFVSLLDLIRAADWSCGQSNYYYGFYPTSDQFSIIRFDTSDNLACYCLKCGR